jgi:hypothetical protein
MLKTRTYCFSVPGILEGTSPTGAIGVDSVVPAFGPGWGTPDAEVDDEPAGKTKKSVKQINKQIA